MKLKLAMVQGHYMWTFIINYGNWVIFLIAYPNSKDGAKHLTNHCLSFKLAASCEIWDPQNNRMCKESINS